MIKVSLCYTTARLGSFDMLFNSVAGQHMPPEEFEVIVVDEMFEARAERVREIHKERYPQINFIHMPPRIKHDYYDNTHGLNTALRAAQGELIAFMIDFTWLSPDYLTSHWDFYLDHPGWSQSGFIDRYDFPPLDESKLTEDTGWWSVFQRDFDSMFADIYFTMREPVYRERKGGAGVHRQDGLIEMPGDKVYLISETIPLDVLRALNGLNEIYDNAYGVNDIDMGTRCNMLGWKFGVNPDCIIRKLGTPELSSKIPGIKKPKARTWDDNFKLYEQVIGEIRAGKQSLRVPDGFGAWA